ncbi:MAG: hypothetical protein V7607_2646 [Solirubrobacteraceae bacterium]
MDERDAISWPPDDPPGGLPRLRVARPPRLWRLHWEPDPTQPVVHNPGRWRFDAPEGQYAVSYANVSEHYVFAEVYCDTDDIHEIGPDQAARRVSYVEVDRDLQVLDLGDASVLSALEIDLRICTTIDYARTRGWALNLRRWLPELDAICYPGRRSGRADNYCLFLDRCGDALQWTADGTLADNEELVLIACELLGLVPRLIFETLGEAWPTAERPARGQRPARQRPRSPRSPS